MLLPAEMEMIRATLLAGGGGPDGPGVTEGIIATNVEATTTVPEELFRKYTETDSRPLTPAPTLASGPLTAHRLSHDEQPATCNPRERTTLILDLRTNSQEQVTIINCNQNYTGIIYETSNFFFGVTDSLSFIVLRDN